ncbi:carboxyl-terminal-processing peptidase 1, chloroplastic [Cannabis sativa]|uniref:carboxyl-terminal-processing peptidase 1, chloroplastic n=1 Tax=Cannabis sativa TaxID=3483 RepID=UPI0011DF361B|nr:carboxyl-terminal-processing peptidase 1, chloroplastic [Cannabis sativa]
MRLLYCHTSIPFHSSNSKLQSLIPNFTPPKTLIRILSGALSLTLIASSPSPFLALESPSSPSSPSSEYCREQDLIEDLSSESEETFVTNEGIVEEAWEIVNDSFLDTSRQHRWSPENWQRKKEDIRSSSIQSRSKAHDVIKRMLASLGDPYTRFLSPDQFSKMARYDVSGIGMNIKEVPDENGGTKLRVLGLVLDGPAHLAGVRQGDEVLAVNGMDVAGKSAFEVLSSIQGPNETSVTLKVKHGNCGPIQSVTIERQVVARTPVFYRIEQMENGGPSVGYMRLKEFNALARKDLAIAMKRLQKMGASYFVLDLRDNLGGLVQAGIEIAKLFLNQGDTVIYTVGKDPQYQQSAVADNQPLTEAPLIVLVNNNTASASEIVASALHDNCRAVLVGEKTFGKGLIQSVFELHDGSGVVVTVGKYVTPNHKDINGNGIEPDYRNFPGWHDVEQRLSQCKYVHEHG